jgi:hypothetical protein
VLGHFVTVDHGADRERDLVPAAQRLFGAPHAGLNGDQLFLGGVEQLASLAGALIGQQRIAADHQALARIIGRGDLGEIARIEQRELDGARLDQAADRRCPQGGDPVEARLRDHAAIADEHHAFEPEALLDLGDLVRQRRRIADICRRTPRPRPGSPRWCTEARTRSAACRICRRDCSRTWRAGSCPPRNR